MILNETQKEKISSLIAQIETKSSAELVAVVAKKSGSYKFLWAFVAFFVMFVLSFFVLSFFQITTNFLFLWGQLFVFCTTYLFFYMYEDFFIQFLPKRYRHQKAWDNAYKNFHNLGLNKTKTKAAIMFYVSLDEKYVAIITDSAIKAKLDDRYWEEIVAFFIKDVKEDKLADGYIRAIGSCGKILIEKFPIKKDDINELSNEVIELI